MKKQLSRPTRRSRSVSAKVATKRGPTKAAKRTRSGATPLAKTRSGIRQPTPIKARRDRVAAGQASADQAQAKEQSLIRHEEARLPENSGSKPNRNWLDWSNATMAANLKTTEELMRCRSPIDLWAVTSRFALRSWYGP